LSGNVDAAKQCDVLGHEFLLIWCAKNRD
jgi:hypothetical protein